MKYNRKNFTDKTSIDENINVDYEGLSDYMKESLTPEQFVEIINSDSFKHCLDNLVLDFYNNIEEILERH
tara:strand:- start:159 stop:368 length:210 start_codon:yes stop_codon:yes gene_type:complete